VALRILGEDGNCGDTIARHISQNFLHFLLSWLRGTENYPEMSKIDSDFTVPDSFFNLPPTRLLFRWQYRLFQAVPIGLACLNSPEMRSVGSTQKKFSAEQHADTDSISLSSPPA
jgi:hypothetical protein